MPGGKPAAAANIDIVECCAMGVACTEDGADASTAVFMVFEWEVGGRGGHRRTNVVFPCNHSDEPIRDDTTAIRVHRACMGRRKVN